MSKRLNPKKRTKKPRLRDAVDYIENSLNGGGTASTFNLDTLDYDVKEYDSLQAIFGDIKDRIHYGVDWASKYAYCVLDLAIENWYNDYEPTHYLRQGILYEAADVWVSGYGGHVYINMNGGHMNMPEILDEAERGVHGTTIEWQRSGVDEIGIWGELIYFLMTTEWLDGNSSAYASMGSIDNAPMLNYAFDAGVFAQGKAPFGRK